VIPRTRTNARRITSSLPKPGRCGNLFEAARRAFEQTAGGLGADGHRQVIGPFLDRERGGEVIGDPARCRMARSIWRPA